MKIILLYTVLLLVLACNKNQNKESIENSSRIDEKQVLSNQDSLLIYTSLNNNTKIKSVQFFLDSIEKADPEKYDLMKVLILKKKKDQFEAQMYENFDKK